MTSQRTDPVVGLPEDGTGDPGTDRARVVEIDRYQVLLDPPRSDLVALVDIAAQVAEVPLATINLITDVAQHQIATKGFDPSVCARADSMCNVVLHDGAPVVVPDASRDPRFADNPFVTGEIGQVRFYASHQLVTPHGVTIGTLCVFDTEAREISDDQERALVELAERVVDLLELELRTRELAVTVTELERARDELQRSNSQLAAFAGQVSHDLRNPLTTVRMALSILAEDPETLHTDPEAGSFLISRAEKGAGRMQALIDDLLAYARIGGRMASKQVDLAAVAADVRDDLAEALGGATLDIGILPVVTGDPVQLRAVLQNLVANAAKFVPAGQPARIRVGASRVRTGWRVEVVDQGLGIAPEDRERVFEPLARAHDDVPGTGIGLATVRRIIDAHAGSIGIEETPGGGTTVWFVLPADTP
ncbi:Phytochrome-like protein cph1 [Nocardioides dokdonensis FR1436]|uniref:Sensor-like histidine kinase SenX3 n=1 Tax=Nocardioides dokdonensis FR1436 TaxID=1300347 RepID=A0A1A9GNN4_9ACTN|nr:GAF domain-containing sensor histidine kinase [Nocardioides dokdonensis]ANH39055.1 Phytochrome-like protein cph1 [Nocardioides dokdonensis FR1436]